MSLFRVGLVIGLLFMLTVMREAAGEEELFEATVFADRSAVACGDELKLTVLFRMPDRMSGTLLNPFLQDQFPMPVRIVAIDDEGGEFVILGPKESDASTIPPKQAWTFCSTSAVIGRQLIVSPTTSNGASFLNRVGRYTIRVEVLRRMLWRSLYDEQGNLCDYDPQCRWSDPTGDVVAGRSKSIVITVSGKKPERAVHVAKSNIADQGLENAYGVRLHIAQTFGDFRAPENSIIYLLENQDSHPRIACGLFNMWGCSGWDGKRYAVSPMIIRSLDSERIVHLSSKEPPRWDAAYIQIPQYGLCGDTCPIRRARTDDLLPREQVHLELGSLTLAIPEAATREALLQSGQITTQGLDRNETIDRDEVVVTSNVLSLE
ncbi:MAG: hypothetical protein R3C01_06470 [Planctomycetaceae bacterium]